jgi:hypothetical protein
MKVLLVCKGEYRYLFPAIAEALQERHDAEVSAVAFSTPATRVLHKTGAFEYVFNLAQWLKEDQNTNRERSVDLLRNLESLHGETRINTMIHADRILRRYPQERIVKILAGVADFWARIWNENPPDLIVGEVACATEWIAWLGAREHGIPYLIPCPTPVANRFFFLDAPDGMWRPMEAAFSRLKAGRLTNEQSRTAEQFVQNFRVGKTKPPFLQWAQQSPLIPEISRIVRRVARIPFRIRTYISDGKFEVGSYHGTAPWLPIWEDAARMARHAVCETAIFARRIDTKWPNIYFPLHVQPEFTTDVRAPFVTNQVALVENVSKSLPAGFQVLVKEHPGMRGERTLDFYRDIKKLHNVQLLSPSLDSHDLIKSSSAVLTITGSSAWEAILYDKPVIAFGPLCYGFYDLIDRCEDISDLPKILSRAIRRFAPQRELLLKFVWSLLGSAHELMWGDPVRQPEITAKENCAKIAGAIAAELASRTVFRPGTEIPA